MLYGKKLLEELKTQRKDLKKEIIKIENNSLGIVISEDELESQYDIPLQILETKIKILNNKGMASFPSVVWAGTQEKVDGIKYILDRKNNILFYDKEQEEWLIPEELPLKYDLAICKNNAWVTRRENKIEIIEADSNYWTGEKNISYLKRYEPKVYQEKIKETKLESGDYYEVGDEFKVQFID